MVRILGSGLVAIVAIALLACSGDSSTTTQNTPASRSTPTQTASGPQASLDPARGRPGTEVVVMGSGWQPGAMITISGAASGTSSGQPYATATATNDGSFTARFRLDRAPGGGTLNPGRVNLVAQSASMSVTLPFEVLPPAPGGQPQPGGPGG